MHSSFLHHGSARRSQLMAQTSIIKKPACSGILPILHYPLFILHYPLFILLLIPTFIMLNLTAMLKQLLLLAIPAMFFTACTSSKKTVSNN